MGIPAQPLCASNKSAGSFAFVSWGLLMRRFLVALIAAMSTVASSLIGHAADMPVKAPVAVAAPAYNWTGFYIGANIGGGWGSRSVNYTPNDPATSFYFSPAGFGGAPPSGSFTTSGVIGGLQLGYNWQFNRNWLVGLETDFNWSGMKGSGSSSGAILAIIPFTASVDEQIKWFGTVRARLGYLPADNLLVYVTGGLAYGKVDHSGSYVNNSAFAATIPNIGGFSVFCNPGTCLAGSSSDVATGWTVGGGLEFALWKNITLKAEYLYVSLGSKSLTETALRPFPGTLPGSFNANYDSTNFNVGRVGVNYRF